MDWALGGFGCLESFVQQAGIVVMCGINADDFLVLGKMGYEGKEERGYDRGVLAW